MVDLIDHFKYVTYVQYLAVIIQSWYNDALAIYDLFSSDASKALTEYIGEIYYIHYI